MAELPYYPDVPRAQQNSIIGGASLWGMAGKSPQEYKGVAKFFTSLSQTDLQSGLRQDAFGLSTRFVGWTNFTAILPTRIISPRSR